MQNLNALLSTLFLALKGQFIIIGPIPVSFRGLFRNGIHPGRLLPKHDLTEVQANIESLGQSDENARKLVVLDSAGNRLSIPDLYVDGINYSNAKVHVRCICKISDKLQVGIGEFLCYLCSSFLPRRTSTVYHTITYPDGYEYSVSYFEESLLTIQLGSVGKLQINGTPIDLSTHDCTSENSGSHSLGQAYRISHTYAPFEYKRKIYKFYPNHPLPQGCIVFDDPNGPIPSRQLVAQRLGVEPEELQILPSKRDPYTKSESAFEVFYGTYMNDPNVPGEFRRDSLVINHDPNVPGEFRRDSLVINLRNVLPEPISFQLLTKDSMINLIMGALADYQRLFYYINGNTGHFAVRQLTNTDLPNVPTSYKELVEITTTRTYDWLDIATIASAIPGTVLNRIVPVQDVQQLRAMVSGALSTATFANRSFKQNRPPEVDLPNLDWNKLIYGKVISLMPELIPMMNDRFTSQVIHLARKSIGPKPKVIIERNLQALFGSPIKLIEDGELFYKLQTGIPQVDELLRNYPIYRYPPVRPSAGVPQYLLLYMMFELAQADNWSPEDFIRALNNHVNGRT